jgi:hypothetical protein
MVDIRLSVVNLANPKSLIFSVAVGSVLSNSKFSGLNFEPRKKLPLGPDGRFLNYGNTLARQLRALEPQPLLPH